MTMKLFMQAITRFLAGVVLMGLLIFLPAGTFFFPKGWLLIGVLFVPMFFAGLVMLKKKPGLLTKRLNMNEKYGEQRNVILYSVIMFVAGFTIAGLNFRFQWHTLPEGVVMVATVLFLIAYVLYGEVLRENEYLSRTVEVQENQKVIDTGVYAIVRHPMYAVTVMLFLSMPLILGSLYAFLIFLAYPFILAKRIRHEEALLEKELAGYSVYKQKVKYRLIPYIW